LATPSLFVRTTPVPVAPPSTVKLTSVSATGLPFASRNVTEAECDSLPSATRSPAESVICDVVSETGPATNEADTFPNAKEPECETAMFFVPAVVDVTVASYTPGDASVNALTCTPSAASTTALSSAAAPVTGL